MLFYVKWRKTQKKKTMIKMETKHRTVNVLVDVLVPERKANRLAWKSSSNE